MRLRPPEPDRAPFLVTSMVVLAVALGAGCAQLIGIENLPDQPPDAQPGTDAVPDASPPCQGEDLHVELRIGGTLVDEQVPGPYVQALLGDVVEISAAGSCARDGAVSYEWTVTPDDATAATAEPALADGPETFTVYPATAGEYRVTLTVLGPDGRRDLDVLAIRARAWQVAPPPSLFTMGEIRGLSVGQDTLWIAAENGAFLLPLAGSPDGFAELVTTGTAVPGDLGTVFFDDRTGFLWFGRAASANGPWRLTTTTSPPESVQIPFDIEEALGGTAQTQDLAAFGTDSIVAATTLGITTVAGAEATFAGRLRPGGLDPVALAMGAGRRMAGSRRLYDLDSDAEHDIGVGGANNQILTMAIDAGNEVLWIGTNGQGVVAFDLRQNAPLATYDESSGLGSNTIHDVLVESEGPYAGDVWVATGAGIARHIRRRETWIHMDADDGLAGHLDLNALAIAQDGNQRVIYAGSRVGVVYMGEP